MSDYTELLTRATRRAEYASSHTDSALIRELVTAIDQLTAPKVGVTLDDLYKQGEQICEQTKRIMDVGVGNRDILKSVAQEYHRALEEAAENPPVEIEGIPVPPTHVTAVVTFADESAMHLVEVDAVQIFDHGQIVAAYEPDGESGHRHIGYYTAEGEFKRFDTRLSTRPGW